MDYETMTASSLYLNGLPKTLKSTNIISTDVYVPQYKKNYTIEIGDTVPGKAITWIRPEHMRIWVADRVILTYVGADFLATSGFNTGIIVSIDGQEYTCRMPYVGRKKGDSNEWDDCLNNAGDDDNLWHWSKCAFWGVESTMQSGKYKHYVRCGSEEARRRRAYISSARYGGVGFRPVLLPRTESLQPQGISTVLDGQNFVFGCARQRATKECRSYLWPVPDRQIANGRNVFAHIPDGTKLSMYTLLMDGLPVRQDKAVYYKQGSQLSITDRYYGPEYLIDWVIEGGKALSEKSIISGIGNEDMINMGLVTRA